MKFAKILIFSEGLTGEVKKYPLLVRLAVLSLAVVYPYLCSLGGFPAMDEGVYAWTSVTYNHNLASGQPLAPLQGFALWPLLLAWIPDLPGLSLLWFRLADMLAALLAGWLLCAILEKECGVYGNLLALVVLIFLTNHHVIDNGFKNSFFPAWACFFGAIYLILHEKIIGGGGGMVPGWNACRVRNPASRNLLPLRLFGPGCRLAYGFIQGRGLLHLWGNDPGTFDNRGH